MVSVPPKRHRLLMVGIFLRNGIGHDLKNVPPPTTLITCFLLTNLKHRLATRLSRKLVADRSPMTDDIPRPSKSKTPSHFEWTPKKPESNARTHDHVWATGKLIHAIFNGQLISVPIYKPSCKPQTWNRKHFWEEHFEVFQPMRTILCRWDGANVRFVRLQNAIT